MRTAIYTLILLSLVLWGCKKADLDGILNLNGNEISVIGHGGMGVASTNPIDTHESSTCEPEKVRAHELGRRILKKSL